jgi:transcriptional regulator with XRE-family HTH domain
MSAAKAIRGWHAGHALKELVGDGRLSAEEAAQQLGVASASLYRYFRAPELPARVAKRIAPRLGVSVDWLMTGRGEKFDAHATLEAAIEQRLERLVTLYLRQVDRETRSLVAKVVRITSALEVFDGGKD